MSYFPSVRLKLNFLEGFAGNIWTGGQLVSLHSFSCATRIPAAAVRQIASQNDFPFLSFSFFYLFYSLFLSPCLTLSGFMCCSFFPPSARQDLLILFCSREKKIIKKMDANPVYKPHSNWHAVIKRARGFIVRWTVTSLRRRPQFAALFMLNS